MTNAGRPILLVVAAALRDREGRILLQRRAAGGTEGGLWEFPGGKIEPGETPETALVRELNEELGIVVDPGDCTPAGFASAPSGTRHLLLTLFLIDRWQGKPAPLVAEGLAWARPADMAAMAMPTPDYPLVEQLVRLMR